MLKLPGILRWLRRFGFPRKLGILDRCYGRVLSRQGIVWVEAANGIVWKLDLANSTHRWIVYGSYEGPALHRWAAAHLPADAVIVDSGANIGQMSLSLAPLIPRGRLLAFEPGQEQADWLAECLSRNPQLPIELIRLGLSDANRAAFLAACGAAEKHGAQNAVDESQGAPIQLARLEDELARRSIDRVQLWKLDVEGHELAALAGAKSLLEQKRIGALYIELYGENGARIVEYLERLDYGCSILDESGRPHGVAQLPEFVNGLFVPK
ncbi:MAG: FkbM family methyltransferase [Planctomycetes bacterium]|nr:FkbM family methyltransferase [Planctomycetota bacterium]